MDTTLLVMILWGLPIWAGALIGARKGRAGWPWGLLLSWPGVLFLALLPNEPADHVATTEAPTQAAGQDAEVQAPTRAA